MLKGYAQSPIEGESFAASLTDPSVPGKETQWFAMLGQRSLYHQGWLACTVHPPLSGWGHFESDVWELYVKDHRLKYAFNWVGTYLQEVEADRDISPGSLLFSVEFVPTGRNDDPHQPGFKGTATLYVDAEAVGSGEIVTQPGAFCLVGDGLCVGRDSGSPVSPDYQAPFRFTAGTIDKVVVDVSGETYIDHEAQVRAWFAID